MNRDVTATFRWTDRSANEPRSRLAFRTLIVPLLFVGLAGSTAVAKPSVAILGIEVIDKQGMSSSKDTQVAQELTNGLRARAKSGGPYALAVGGDKELIDLKLIRNCEDERPACMAVIGADLGADFLLYGKLEKTVAAYSVSVVLLDVKRKARDKTYTEAIPISESTGAALQARTKKLYAALTGQTENCAIVVKVAGPDRATLFLDDDVSPAAAATNGTGQLQNVPVGRHQVAVEAPGFQRWERKDVTCAAGQTAVVNAELRPGSGSGAGGVGTAGSEAKGGAQAASDRSGSSRSSWRKAAIGGAVATGILATGFGVSWGLLASTGASKKPGAGPFEYGGNCSTNEAGNSVGPGLCSSGRGLRIATFATGIAAGVGFAFTVFALIKTVSAPDPAERAATTRRAPESTLAITPVLGPDTAGASLQFAW